MRKKLTKTRLRLEVLAPGARNRNSGVSQDELRVLLPPENSKEADWSKPQENETKTDPGHHT